MAYIDESLSKGEEIHEIFKHHWVSKIPMIIWLVLGIPTFGITLVLAIWEWLKLRNLEQGVTNKRVIRKSGIISRKSDEMKIRSIETVEIDQGVFGRLFGFGNVKITGHGISDVMFKKIDNPLKVKKAVESVEAV